MFPCLPRNALPLGAALLAIAATPARPADWTQYRGNRPHTADGAATSGRLLVPLWTRRLPAITVGSTVYQPAITSSPAIADGAVYIGSRNTHLYALSAASGALLWEYAAGTEIESSPLVQNGTVYFVPYSGTLTALNASDGSVRWTHASGGSSDRSSPNLSAGNIICATGWPRKDIYAVPADAPNPAPRAWTFSTGYNTDTGQYDPSAGQFIYASPAVDPATENIYCPSDDGKLYALKPDGTALWTKPFVTTGGFFRASPAVANGKVYVCAGDYDWALHAVDAATGQTVWDAPMVPEPEKVPDNYRAIAVSSPAVDGDFIAIVGGYGNARGPSTLYAFQDKGASVASVWTAPLPNVVLDSYVSSPALTPSSVIIGVAAAADADHPNYPRGRVYMVDRATGQSIWYAAGDATNAGGPILSSPALSGDLVVVGDNSGLVTAYQSVPAGDVDGDNKVTALDALKLMSYASGTGEAPPDVRYRGDLYPTDSVAPDGARSFGDGRITPADADLVLQYALGLKPHLP